jgi:hypothetical protein
MPSRGSGSTGATSGPGRRECPRPAEARVVVVLRQDTDQRLARELSDSLRDPDAELQTPGIARVAEVVGRLIVVAAIIDPPVEDGAIRRQFMPDAGAEFDMRAITVVVVDDPAVAGTNRSSKS